MRRWLYDCAMSKTESKYISNRANNRGEEMAELFVHLCGFNFPISKHSKRYAEVLKVIHGEDCLGDTVKYQ